MSFPTLQIFMTRTWIHKSGHIISGLLVFSNRGPTLQQQFRCRWLCWYHSFQCLEAEQPRESRMLQGSINRPLDRSRFIQKAQWMSVKPFWLHGRFTCPQQLHYCNGSGRVVLDWYCCIVCQKCLVVKIIVTMYRIRCIEKELQFLLEIWHCINSLMKSSFDY